MSGEHAAPVGWLARWNEAEPVRLYLWSIATAVAAASVAAGWLTTEIAVAVTGVVSAVLMVGGAAAARRVAYAPATVDEYALRWTEYAEDEFRRGVLVGVDAAHERTPDEVAAVTLELRTQQVQVERDRCREVDEGRRCGLRREHDGPHMMSAT